MQKISRSAVEQHMNCQRCFYLAYKYKVRPFTLPFTLNSAVDNLCKNEFDHYRAKAKPHPMFIEHGIDAVPFAHEKMDEWRENFKHLWFILLYLIYALLIRRILNVFFTWSLPFSLV